MDSGYHRLSALTNKHGEQRYDYKKRGSEGEGGYFHGAVRAVVSLTSSDVILGKNVHCFSGHDAEELHKAASAIEMALGISHAIRNRRKHSN
jgi:hypothetical protein